MSEELKPCRSPYCECEKGKCTHPGFFDARGSKPIVHYQSAGVEIEVGKRAFVCPVDHYNKLDVSNTGPVLTTRVIEIDYETGEFMTLNTHYKPVSASKGVEL